MYKFFVRSPDGNNYVHPKMKKEFVDHGFGPHEKLVLTINTIEELIGFMESVNHPIIICDDVFYEKESVNEFRELWIYDSYIE